MSDISDTGEWEKYLLLLLIYYLLIQFDVTIFLVSLMYRRHVLPISICNLSKTHIL